MLSDSPVAELRPRLCFVWGKEYLVITICDSCHILSLFMHTIIIKSDIEQPKQQHMAPGRNRKFIKISSSVLFYQKIDFHIFSTKVWPMPGGDFNNFKQVRCKNNEHNKADDQRKHPNYSESPVTTSQIVMSWWKGDPNFVILFYIGKVFCALLFITALWVILRCIFMKSKAQRKKVIEKVDSIEKSFSLLACGLS